MRDGPAGGLLAAPKELTWSAGSGPRNPTSSPPTDGADYFALWCTVKSIKPKHIIESGIYAGQGSWFLRQSAGEDVQMSFVSPKPPTLYRDKSPTSAYAVGKDIKDFAAIDWNSKDDVKQTHIIF